MSEAQDDALPPSFPRDLFDAVVEMYWRIGTGDERIEVTRQPPKILLTNKACQVTIVETDGALQVSARTAAERALLTDKEGELRYYVDQDLAKRAATWKSIGELSEHTSTTFGRAEFDALIGTIERGAHSGSVRADDVTDFMPSRKEWGCPARVLFVRKSSAGEFTRVRIYDLDGTLRTTATPEQAAFVDEVGALAGSAIDRLVALKAQIAAEAVAKAKQIDREVLVEALEALTHMRVEVQPIATAIMLASTDPRRYVAEHAARCLDYGITGPVEGLHVIALFQHLPEAHLVYFDWKESMRDVLPRLVAMLRAGPRIALDAARYESRYDAWDRKPPIVAVKEIAKDIPGAILVEIDTSADAYAVACVADRDYARLRAFKTKAHLPLKALAKPPSNKT